VEHASIAAIVRARSPVDDHDCAILFRRQSTIIIIDGY